ncbi:glycosyltransferase family 9 protein [Celerinatantimonas sp. YJH-8]|uniref:glycosyltransferase family 9 protein n=1 Tax=Celerinatantimonas sp. YJH-8 TaxID=3228714 RepID=UPI0038C7C971
MASSQRILVAISDISGDGMLAWPALQMLVRSYPGCHIDLLAGRSSALLAAGLEGIEQIYDETLLRQQLGARRLRQQLRHQQYSDYLCLSPLRRHRWLGRLLGIHFRFLPTRGRRRFWDGEAIGRPIGPMCWRRVYEKVVLQCLQKHKQAVVQPQSPYWRHAELSVRNMSDHALVVVYPGVETGPNIGIDQYQQLLSSLNLVSGAIEFVLCSRVHELSYCQALASGLAQEQVACRIAEFSHDWDSVSKLMLQADLVIGAQGPILWLAGAMDIPCVGFGALSLGSEMLRHPLANLDRCLMFTPPLGRLTQEDISLINATDSAVRIRHWFHQLHA